MPIFRDARYKITQRLELARRSFQRWNTEEVGNIFRRLEAIEMSITELHEWEDQEDKLGDRELAAIRGLLSKPHPLLS